MRTKHYFLLLCIVLFGLSSATAQLVLPETSQRAEVKQRIGYTDITVVYHSPAVNSRKIWGDLVPYGQVWRAGANTNTTVSFTDDVTINGSPLPAGTYGLHMIPGEQEWQVIFSKNSTSWGSYFYKKEEDALRVTVKAEPHEHVEWLDYSFTGREAASAKLALSWDKIRVPISIGVDVHTIALRHIREQLRNMPGFTWEGWEEAAQYCITNKVNYEEALKWINTSIRMNENFTNTATKARLQAAMGSTAEAEATKKKMLTLLETAGENQVNAYGYQLLNNEHDVKTAIEVFKLNVKKHPDSWNAYDSMGEAYGVAGDKKQALANYKIALAKAPEDQKTRIQGVIAKM
jgi:tetratricopeptide (TPR) repeat protein